MLPFNIKSSKGAEDVLGKYLYGRNSTLSKIVGSGDFQALGRLANAFGKTLDTVKQITSASLAQTVKQTKEQKRTKVMLQIKSHICICTFFLLFTVSYCSPTCA